MDEIRKYFEKVTLSSFGGDDGCEFNFETGTRKWLRKPNGEYVSGNVEDHWQTFQEGWEAATEFMKKNRGNYSDVMSTEK